MAKEREKTARPSMTERFRAFLAPIEGTDGCLRWTGTTHRRTRVGLFMVAPGCNWAANRVAYVLAHAEPLVASQAIEATCSTGKFCVNGAHWTLSQKPRRRPTNVVRYTRERKAEVLSFLANGLSLIEATRAFGIEPRTLVRWQRERRQTLNGSAHEGEVPA